MGRKLYRMKTFTPQMLAVNSLVICSINENLRFSEEDYGIDLSPIEDATLDVFCVNYINTGVKVKLPPYLAGLVLPRSSLPSKGLSLLNSPGLIDAGYRGEIKLILSSFNYLITCSKFTQNLNMSSEIIIPKGTRLCQLIFVYSFIPDNYTFPENTHIYLVESKEVFDKFENLFPSYRASNGIGSTGV